MQAIVQGLATNYIRIGKGRQLLVLHGWADDGKSWVSLAKELRDNYEVIVPDLPGFGGTETPQSAWSLDSYADFVKAFIAKISISPYAIIAHSNGGSIALRGIGGDKLHVEKLVLLASAGIRNEGKGRKSTWQVVAKTGKAVSAPLPPSVKGKLRNALYRAAGSDMLVAEHMQETFKRVVAEDARTDAEKVTIPTLLIYGTDDTSTPSRYGELLQQHIASSKFKTIPGVGHFLQRDALDKVSILVKDFLK